MQVETKKKKDYYIYIKQNRLLFKSLKRQNGHYTMIKGSIHQNDIFLKYIYTHLKWEHTNILSKY